VRFDGWMTSSRHSYPDYVYGLTPVIMRAVRDLQTAVPDQSTPGKAPLNQFSYSTQLVTPDDQTVVRPNVDTLYTTAWLDLGAEPVIPHVPDMGTRYYVVPMLDAYSNVFDSVGSRTTGNGAGNYAIVGPDWTGPKPQNVWHHSCSHRHCVAPGTYTGARPGGPAKRGVGQSSRCRIRDGNGWSVNFNTGEYGTNYLLRDGIALLGLGANLLDDAVYFSTWFLVDDGS
jgi:Protein of unknown function (DUF1254)